MPLVESPSGPSSMHRTLSTPNTPGNSVSLARQQSASDAEKAAVRIVGRGGRGSKHRNGSISLSSKPSFLSLGSSLSPQSSASHPESTSPSPPPLGTNLPPASTTYRVSGRGGLGSKPRPVKAPTSPTLSETRSLSSKSLPEDEVPLTQPVIKMGGRGGAGARPRQIKTKPTIEKSKSFSGLKAKLKNKGKALPSSTPDPFSRSKSSLESCSTDANSFVSSLYFAPPPNPSASKSTTAANDEVGPSPSTSIFPPLPPSPTSRFETGVPSTPTYYHFPHPDDDQNARPFTNNIASAKKVAKTLGHGAPVPFSFNHISKRKMANKIDSFGHLPGLAPRLSDPLNHTASDTTHSELGELHRNPLRDSTISFFADNIGPDGIPHPPSPVVFAAPPSPTRAVGPQAHVRPPSGLSFSTQDTLFDGDGTSQMTVESTAASPYTPYDIDEDPIAEGFESKTTSVESHSTNLPSYHQSVAESDPEIVAKNSIPFMDSYVKPKRSTDTFGNITPSHARGYYQATIRTRSDGQDWEGEWNHDSLDDVIVKLRMLR